MANDQTTEWAESFKAAASGKKGAVYQLFLDETFYETPPDKVKEMMREAISRDLGVSSDKINQEAVGQIYEMFSDIYNEYKSSHLKQRRRNRQDIKDSKDDLMQTFNEHGGIEDLKQRDGIKGRHDILGMIDTGFLGYMKLFREEEVSYDTRVGEHDSRVDELNSIYHSQNAREATMVYTYNLFQKLQEGDKGLDSQTAGMVVGKIIRGSIDTYREHFGTIMGVEIDSINEPPGRP